MSDTVGSGFGSKLGWTLSILVTVALVANGLFSLLGRLFAPEALAAMSAAGGFTMDQTTTVGAIMLIGAIVYAIPRTAVLGAILLTGFVGGAICTEYRIGLVFSASQLTNVILGILPWAGLYFRDPRVRALLPLRS